ncbi:hypothetical protein [Anaerofustis sp.]|uniref:hypothetical protein n=1 Tax=Anaerofustis sp. TaxID=1872517 RepID=UPI0025B921B9|nr:hypothetical protein [Anaerofustis sp.]
MMNIYCTLDCKHQEGGMCTLYDVPLYISGLSDKCMYYLPSDDNKYKEYTDKDKSYFE